jgi:hypothetical protein
MIPPRWPALAAAALLTLGRAPIAAAPQAPSSVDSVALLGDLAALSADSMEGRAPGTEGSRRARDFLVRRLSEAGAEPLRTSYRHPFEWEGGSGENLVGIVPGALEDSFIVLTAHYDHVGVRDGEIYNGADDNASGVAAVLEATRRAREVRMRHTLVVALLDAEEAGLRGARAFVADPPVPLAGVVLNVNLDMVARTDGVLWAAGASHTPALRPVLESVAADAPTTLRLGHDRPGAPEGDDWSNASDHGPFLEAGVPFVYFGVEDHADYHRPTDDFERVDPGEYVDAVRTILAALRALDAALPVGAPREGGAASVEPSKSRIPAR